MKAFVWTALCAMYVAVIYGYIANIVKLVGMFGGEVTAYFLGRCLGVVMPPLGVVLGFL